MLADKGAASMPTESIRMLRGVRQTREFQDRPVPDDALRDILEVARWSGSSRNSQPWELVVIADRDTLQRLAELIPFGKFLARAQLGIAVVMHGAGQGQSLDAGRIAERMMIAAHARGIGAGLATIPDAALERQALELLGVPAGHSLGVALAFGLPAARDPAAPKRPGAGRRPLGEIVHHNRFGQRSH
jgi:nitroreductase